MGFQPLWEYTKTLWRNLFLANWRFLNLKVSGILGVYTRNTLPVHLSRTVSLFVNLAHCSTKVDTRASKSIDLLETITLSLKSFTMKPSASRNRWNSAWPTHFVNMLDKFMSPRQKVKSKTELFRSFLSQRMSGLRTQTAIMPANKSSRILLLAIEARVVWSFSARHTPATGKFALYCSE